MIIIIELTREEKAAMKQTMANRLPEFRKLLGVTQQKFGNNCGLLRDRLSIIERGATEMTWVQFLSILFVLLFNSKTKSLIMRENLFPIKLYQSLQFLKEDEVPETYIRINPLDSTATLELDNDKVFDTSKKSKTALLKDVDVEEKNISFKELIEYIPNPIKAMDERIAKYSSFFAREIMEHGGYDELNDSVCDIIEEAFSYANVGYAFLPENLWGYKSAVTEAETELIRLHMTKGFNALFSTKMMNEDENIDKIIQLAMDVSLSHHEVWNGTGVPYGLKGNKIPLLGRIYAICDMYDSILTGRNGEEAMPHDFAVTEIVHQSGKLFDPKLTRIFYLNRDKLLLLKNCSSK